MSKIDLRELGQLTEECEKFLAQLIARSAIAQPLKNEFMLEAKDDFEWQSEKLMPYVEAKMMTRTSTRPMLADGKCISSSEWLCGLFASDSNLSNEHVRILISFINPLTDFTGEQYVSGRSAWVQAPQPLKTILNVLDDAALANEGVHVVTAKWSESNSESEANATVVWSE